MSGKEKLHMNAPIWVWCYIAAEIRDGRDGIPPLSAWPQAHTYAFRSEAEANAHPAAMGWAKGHGYTLQKVYLQEPSP